MAEQNKNAEVIVKDVNDKSLFSHFDVSMSNVTSDVIICYLRKAKLTTSRIMNDEKVQMDIRMGKLCVCV